MKRLVQAAGPTRHHQHNNTDAALKPRSSNPQARTPKVSTRLFLADKLLLEGLRCHISAFAPSSSAPRMARGAQARGVQSAAAMGLGSEDWASRGRIPHVRGLEPADGIYERSRAG